MATGGESWKMARGVLRDENIDLSGLKALDASNIAWRED